MLPPPIQPMYDWFLILIGLVALVVAADWLVRGSVWIALVAGISQMVVGLTLVAFGTSAPELFVSLNATLKDLGGLATGNALGSNIANIGLIIGLTAVVKPIRHPAGAARFEVRFGVAVTGLMFVPLLLGIDLERIQGLVLVGLLTYFTLALIGREKQRRRSQLVPDDKSQRPKRGGWQATLHIGLVIVGLAGLKFGSDWLVQGCSAVAERFGMTPQLIGLTIVAVGTSLPELATSIAAARKGHPEIALGNVLGSNIFNICMVLGTTAVIVPLPLTWRDGSAVGVAVALAIALGASLRVGGGVSRRTGIALLCTYAGYLAWAVLTRE